MTAPALTVDAKGLGRAAPPERCIVVIFGAKGDLTRRELLPSLYELAHEDLLPRDFALVGFSRGDWDDDRFRAAMREAVRAECDFDEAAWCKFATYLSFIPGDITSPVEGDYARLRAKLAALSGDGQVPDNVLFHLAVPPDHFGTIIERLGAAGLARSEHGWRRLLIEKPFGRDRDTALELDRGMRQVFTEDQIYRIDHFLGKETVQNMLVVRFANPSFEPIWNRNYIDHVEITVAEDIGIGTRAGFYESTGVVRDMVQNHLLQLLCMVAIEPPVRFDGDALRDETVKVLRSVQPVDAARDVVLGQYGPGTVNGKPLQGYRQEANVARGSVTPTYAALRLAVSNWRWAGVPFYLRTGKRLGRQLTEIAIQFKPTPHLMFPVRGAPLDANQLVFRLQPDEGIIQTFSAKQPGPGISISRVRSTFSYASAFGVETLPRAYAWLLLDAMLGDQTMFARSDWIFGAWSIVDPINQYWDANRPEDFPNYSAGTSGPDTADFLLARDGRAWNKV